MEQDIQKQKESGEAPKHAVALSFVKVPVQPLNPGVFMVIKVRGACEHFCNIQAADISIRDQHGNTVKNAKLILPEGPGQESDSLVVQAPVEAGEHQWQIVFLEQEIKGIKHEMVILPFCFEVLSQHTTSMAVWGIENPIEAGESFLATVGVKCAAGCAVDKREIAVVDESGKIVASGILEDASHYGGGAMYCARVPVTAPEDAGAWEYEARLSSFEEHEGCSMKFSIRVVMPAQCKVFVNVRAKGSGAPLQGAEVVLPPYKTVSDKNGKAELLVAKGEYTLHVFAGQAFFPHRLPLRVREDSIMLEAEMEEAPPILD